LDTHLSSKYASLRREQLLWIEKGDEKILVLPQTLDESFDFPKEEPKLRHIVVLECKAVRHVSSAWAAKFVNWHRKLHPKQQYAFRNCPRKMIDLMNFVVGFLPKDVVIESFEAPYECTNCGHEQSETMARGKDYVEAQPGCAPLLRIPFELNCDKCPGMMEFSVLENIYLRFLNSTHES
jgi:hypothetical protein